MQHAVQFAFREVQARRPFAYQALGLAAAVAVLTYLGPFDTWGRLALPERAAFWSVAMAANWIVGMVVGFGAILAFERRGTFAWAAVATVGSAVAAIPGTAVIWLLVATFLDFRISGLAGLASLYSQVIGIHLVVTFVVTWPLARLSREEPHKDLSLRTPDAGAPGNAFLKRIPARLGQNLLHLHMQDHYLEVHTDRGSDLLLMRFRDALREVENLDGAKVHRSHWVARAAIERIERRNGRIVLHLMNGNEVPVSRSFTADLRDRNWL